MIGLHPIGNPRAAMTLNSRFSSAWFAGCLAALAATGCTDDLNLLEQTVNPIDQTGGTAVSADGLLTVELPPNAVDGPTAVVITTRRDIEGDDLASLVYQLEPEGIDFGASVTLRIETTEVANEEVVVEQVDEDGQTIAVLQTNGDGSAAEASLDHFSFYSLRRLRRACRQLSCGDTCTLCPPHRPNCSQPPGPRACSSRGFCIRENRVSCPPQNAGLVFSPASIDFGSLSLTCTSTNAVATASVTASNATANLLVINNAVVTGSTDFTAFGLSTSSIAAGGSVGFFVTYQPSSPGTDSANYEVTTSAGTFRLPLSGEAVNQTTTGTLSETFFQRSRRRVDVLIGLDTSASMSDSRVALQQEIARLAQTLGPNLDFNLGIVAGTQTSSITQIGELLGIPAVVSSTDAASWLGANINQPLFGSNEQLYDAVVLALTPPLINGPNAGFYRADAFLSVLFITDKNPRNTTLANGGLEGFLDRLKGMPVNRQIQVNAVSGGTNACSGPAGIADASPNLDALVTAFDGKRADICSFDWSSPLTNLGPTWYGLQDRFVLQQRPTPGTISVSVNGQNLPPGTGWSVDASTRTLTFSGSAVPPPGASIEVFYQYGCP